VLVLLAAAFYAAGYFHYRYWWRIHDKQWAARPDSQVRDWRDVMDKWWGTALGCFLGTVTLLAAVGHLVRS
jgi:hypothetical protein